MAKEAKEIGVVKPSATIEPNRWYTLYEIAEGGFFRGYQAAQSVRRIILADKNKKNILQTIVQGDANGRRSVGKVRRRLTLRPP